MNHKDIKQAFETFYLANKIDFDERRHEYKLDGVICAGISSISEYRPKNWMPAWGANMAVGYIQKKILEAETGTVLDNLSQWIEEARKAHCKRKTDAGDWGTKMHELVEKNIKGEEQEIPETHKKSFENFLEWVEKNKVKFLESEKNIYSEKLWLGGIVDFVCEIDGEVWIGDIKTAKSGIYPEHFWQCAGYQLMLQEMGLYPNVKGYIILNLKQDGKVLEKRSISNGDNTKAFLACLDIYRIKEKIKNQII